MRKRVFRISVSILAALCMVAGLMITGLPESISSVWDSGLLGLRVLENRLPSEANAESVVDSGRWGSSTSWKIDANGTLTISGNGRMADGESIDYDYPWNNAIYGITDIVIKEGVTSIADRAFGGMTGVKSVWMPNSLYTIGNGAFAGCGFESVNIPAGVRTIGDGPFATCRNLKVITVSPDNPYFTSEDGVLYSKDHTLLIQCPTKRSGTYTVYEDTVKICRYAFQQTKITAVILPYKVNSIEYGAFSECYGLESVTIPEGVTLIDNYGFNNCINLRLVSLPTTLKRIGDYAFNGNGPTLAVSFTGTPHQWNSITIGSNNGRLYTADKSYFNPYDESNYVPAAHLKWISWGDSQYWYENGIRQGTYYDPNGIVNLTTGDVRGREIYDPESKGWYWLDSIYSGAKARNKEVWIPYVYQDEENYSDEEIEAILAKSPGMENQVREAIKNHSREGGGKWVRYDKDGKMIKGWYFVDDEEIAIYPDQKNATYYYDPVTGMMAKGWTCVYGEMQYFDPVTGAHNSSMTAP